MIKSLQHVIQSSISFLVFCVKCMLIILKAECMNHKVSWEKQKILYNDVLPSSGQL